LLILYFFSIFDVYKRKKGILREKKTKKRAENNGRTDMGKLTCVNKYKQIKNKEAKKPKKERKYEQEGSSPEQEKNTKLNNTKTEKGKNMSSSLGRK
jgi:hypothetical protein